MVVLGKTGYLQTAVFLDLFYNVIFVLFVFVCFNFVIYSILALRCPSWEVPVALLGKAQQLQEQRYPSLSMYPVCSCVQTMLWLSMPGIINMRTDVDASVCTRGLYGHRKRACIGS